MDFRDSIEALETAKTAGALSEDRIHWLAGLCRSELAGGGAPAHSVPYNAASWPGSPKAPAKAVRSREATSSRSLMRRPWICSRRATPSGWDCAATARYQQIVAATADLAGRLERVREIGRCQGPVAAYAQLYGGDGVARSAPGAAPWSRIKGLGPTFFTKFLYFAVPGALILDNVLSRRVDLLTAMGEFRHKGQPLAWPPYRYAVYLHWMTQTAAAVTALTRPLIVTPDLVELTLFKARAVVTVLDPADEGDAAD